MLKIALHDRRRLQSCVAIDVYYKYSPSPFFEMNNELWKLVQFLNGVVFIDVCTSLCKAPNDAINSSFTSKTSKGLVKEGILVYSGYPGTLPGCFSHTRLYTRVLPDDVPY